MCITVPLSKISEKPLATWWISVAPQQEDLEFKPRQGCSVWSVHVLSMLAWVVSRRSGFSHFWEKNSYRLLWAQDTPTKETDFMSFTSWLDNVTCERSSGHWKMILNIFWNVKGHLFLMDTSGNVSHLNSKHLKTRWKQDTVFHWKEANTVNSHCNSPWYLCICRCTWLE